MMFSVTSWSAEVMNRFTPSRCHDPSSWRTAFVRPAPTSDPASGSVSTIVAPQPRSIMSSAQRCCSGVPLRCTMAAKPGPDMYMNAAGLAPRISSAAAHCTLGGTP